jgi:hypothetical protein
MGQQTQQFAWNFSLAEQIQFSAQSGIMRALRVFHHFVFPCLAVSSLAAR